MFDIHRCQRTGTFVCAIALSAFSFSGQAFAQYGNSTPVRPVGSGTMEMRPNQQAGQADVQLAPALPAPNQQQPLPRPQQQPVMQQPQEFAPAVLIVLKKWEQFGLQTQKLQGKHTRIVYDETFKVMKLCQGEFYYENPDKGRLDLYPVKVEKDAMQNGYKLQSEQPESWICDGQLVTSINLARKEYDQFPIPQEAQGQNIIDSPLPFLFGLTVEKAKNRYILTTGSMHAPDKVIHLIAEPLLAGDAAEWSKAEICLDAASYLPTAIKLTAPGGQVVTVYKFTEATRNKQERLVFLNFGKDPFHPSLSGFTKAQHPEQSVGSEPPRPTGTPVKSASLQGMGPR